jgi:ketosteroid isomerase-like protein
MDGHNPSMSADHVETVRRGFDAAVRGDFDPVQAILAPDVHWFLVGEEEIACHNRDQALARMRQGSRHGINLELLDVHEIDDDHVLVLLQRLERRDGDPPSEPPEPHGQILTFRQDKIVEMAVYPTADAALDAAGIP